MMETVSIDRFEEDIAVCERDDLTTIQLLKADLPDGAKPGSILTINNEGLITLDEEEESRRRKKIADMYKAILNKNNKDNR